MHIGNHQVKQLCRNNTLTDDCDGELAGSDIPVCVRCSEDLVCFADREQRARREPLLQYDWDRRAALLGADDAPRYHGAAACLIGGLDNVDRAVVDVRRRDVC